MANNWLVLVLNYCCFSQLYGLLHRVKIYSTPYPGREQAYFLAKIGAPYTEQTQSEAHNLF